MEGGRGGVDVGVVLGSGLLEAVQGGVAVVSGQTLVLLAFTGQLHAQVFGQRDAHTPAKQPLTVQVAHGWKHEEERSGGGGGGGPDPPARCRCVLLQVCVSAGVCYRAEPGCCPTSGPEPPPSC